MTGYNSLRGDEVRAKLDHPVIDADAHIVECNFALMDYLAQVAGKEFAARAATMYQNAGAHGTSVKGFWWGLSSGEHTNDRALAMLPRYFRSRLDELGIDFAHCYTTLGLAHLYLVNDELRRATCRALNTMYADMFKGCGDRLRPVAVIPTYSPKEALAELEYAVGELGFKAVHIGTELRGPSQAAPGADPLAFQTQSTPFHHHGFALRLRSVLAPLRRVEGGAGVPHLVARRRLSRVAQQLCLQPSRRFRGRARISSAARSSSAA